MSVLPTPALLAPPRSLPHSVRVADYRTDVTARLRVACAHLPPAGFAALVEDICAIKGR